MYVSVLCNVLVIFDNVAFFGMLICFLWTVESVFLKNCSVFLFKAIINHYLYGTIHTEKASKYYYKILKKFLSRAVVIQAYCGIPWYHLHNYANSCYGAWP